MMIGKSKLAFLKLGYDKPFKPHSRPAIADCQKLVQKGLLLDYGDDHFKASEKGRAHWTVHKNRP
jgi:hypothetical protein